MQPLVWTWSEQNRAIGPNNHESQPWDVHETKKLIHNSSKTQTWFPTLRLLPWDQQGNSEMHKNTILFQQLEMYRNNILVYLIDYKRLSRQETYNLSSLNPILLIPYVWPDNHIYMLSKMRSFKETKSNNKIPFSIQLEPLSIALKMSVLVTIPEMT